MCLICHMFAFPSTEWKSNYICYCCAWSWVWFSNKFEFCVLLIALFIKMVVVAAMKTHLDSTAVSSIFLLNCQLIVSNWRNEVWKMHGHFKVFKKYRLKIVVMRWNILFVWFKKIITAEWQSERTTIKNTKACKCVAATAAAIAICECAHFCSLPKRQHTFCF